MSREEIALLAGLRGPLEGWASDFGIWEIGEPAPQGMPGGTHDGSATLVGTVSPPRDLQKGEEKRVWLAFVTVTETND